MVKPGVSVILAVHNGASYLRESLRSILAQDHPDFEVVAVNDGSTDASADILEEMAEAYPRLRVLHRPKGGLGASLNAAAAAAHGELLARMDADDVSLPDRLTRQASHLAAYPKVAVCGTFIRTFGAPHQRTVRLPIEDELIRAELFFSCPIMHPSVMLRREVLDALGGYNPGIRYGEDYDLWTRAMNRFRFANIPEVLLRYRRHPGQMDSHYALEEQATSRRHSMATALAHIGLAPDASTLALHHALSLSPCLTLTIPAEPDFLARAEVWLSQILSANKRSGFLPWRSLAAVVGRYWYFACFGAMLHDRLAFDHYRRSPLSRLARIDALSRAAIALGGLGGLTEPARIAALALDAYGLSRFGDRPSGRKLE